jgi:hypothetical protein
VVDDAASMINVALYRGGTIDAQTLSEGGTVGHKIKQVKLRRKTGDYLVAVMDAHILSDGVANH